MESILFNGKLTAWGKCEIATMCKEINLDFGTVCQEINKRNFQNEHMLLHYCKGLISVQVLLKELANKQEGHR